MDAAAEFFKQGILGVAIVVLAGVIVFLYKENKGLSNDYRDLAEKRVADLAKLKDDYFNNLTTLKDAYFANQQTLKDVVESVYNIVSALKDKIK